ISGSMSSRGPERKHRAALFRSPTSSSNSEANTEDGRWIVASFSTSFSSSSSLISEAPLLKCEGPAVTSSEGPDASFRCCR
uniref:Uncharacterized protein n=1 Tax=Poecilia latipinna TaxID=48699 RepID=A0A3B3W0N5_9TELE